MDLKVVMAFLKILFVISVSNPIINVLLKFQIF